MIEATKNQKGDIISALDFDFTRFGNKNDGEKYVNKSCKMSLYNGGLTVFIQETYPNNKEKSQWESFYVPNDCIEYFVQGFKEFTKELIKEKKATKSFTSEKKPENGKAGEKKIIQFYGVIEDGEKKLTYINISIQNGEKKTSFTTAFQGATTFRSTKAQEVDKVDRFISKLYSLNESLTAKLITKIDGTYHDHMSEVNKNKDAKNNLSQEAETTTTYESDNDEPVF